MNPSDWQIKPKKLSPDEKRRQETERACKAHLEGVCADRLLLLAIVTGGKEHYRGIASKAFKGFLVDDAMLDSMFGFFVEQAGPEPKQQYEELQRAELVGLKLDKLKGLARLITDEAHLDAVLDKWVPEGDERRAIRSQMLLFMKTEGWMH